MPGTPSRPPEACKKQCSARNFVICGELVVFDLVLAMATLLHHNRGFHLFLHAMGRHLVAEHFQIFPDRPAFFQIAYLPQRTETIRDFNGTAINATGHIYIYIIIYVLYIISYSIYTII